MSKVMTNCNKLHRFITFPSFLNTARPLTVVILHSRNLRQQQQHFENSLIGENKSFSSTCTLKSEMENCGGYVNDAFNINYKQLLKVQQDLNVLIIDVREHSEIKKTGALPGSIHIPMCEVVNELTNLSCQAFREKYNREQPTKDTKIVFSCRSGKRSAMVQDQLQKSGYQHAYNYTGGWNEWEYKNKSS